MKYVTERNHSVQSLEQLSLEDLKALKARAQELIYERTAERRKEALRELEYRASQLGFDLADLVRDARHRKIQGQNSEGSTRSQVFVHPDNPSLTWSGRGRHPLWFKNLLRSGVDPTTLYADPPDN